MLLSYKPLHLEAQQRIQEEGCVVDINEVLNFKQRGGENLKDAWYRICDAQNRSTRKQSTTVLLRNFYVGVTTWYRFVLDTIAGGNFLGSRTMHAFNAMGNLVVSPPITINETTLTLKHVMQRLEVIENRMPTIELSILKI